MCKGETKTKTNAELFDSRLQVKFDPEQQIARPYFTTGASKSNYHPSSPLSLLFFPRNPSVCSM